MECHQLLVFIVCSVVIGCVYGGVHYTDCGSKMGTIKSVNVGSCQSPPCKLKKNTNVTFSVDFITKEVVKSATSVVHGIIAGIPVPFPISNPNACEHCGLTCPLKSGSSYTFHSNVFVKKEYPDIKVPVKWEMKDGSKNDVFCLVVLAEIVD